jgi:hypothetical protein
VADNARAWLYVRGEQSVRVEMQDGRLAVFGPGALYHEIQFDDGVAAMLEHSHIEQELVRDGWSLEQMTTERRGGQERRAAPRGPDRRRVLKLVR